MGENEKLGFTCEEVPFDFSTFTPWVDGETSSTTLWNGSQNPNLGDYLKVREFIQPKGTEVVPKEDFMQELGGKPHEVKFDIHNCKVSYKDGQIVVDELTKLPMGIIATNMSQDDLKQNGFPILFVKGDPRKSKRKKHYKPKFTL